MTLLTTTIGAYPKPDYVTVPDWFGKARGDHDDHPTENWAGAVAALGEEAEEIFARGTREAVVDQIECGIDIPTDGEIRREDYIYYHCRHLNGINFDQLVDRTFRTGTFTAKLSTNRRPGQPTRDLLARRVASRAVIYRQTAQDNPAGTVDDYRFDRG